MKNALRPIVCIGALLALFIATSFFFYPVALGVDPGKTTSEVKVPAAKLQSAIRSDETMQSAASAPVLVPATREIVSQRTEPDHMGRETMTGRVVDETGQSVDHFRLQGSFRNSVDGKWEERDLGSHSGGDFQIQNLLKGRWRITAMHEDFLPSKPTRLRLPLKGEPIVITMRRGAILSGTIVDFAGIGLADAEIVIKTGSKTHSHAGNDLGQFRVLLEPGPFICIGRRDDFASSDEVRGELRGGEARRIELTLTEGGRLIGVVQDSKGQVLPKYSIYLYSMDWKSTDQEIQADELGRFAFERLTPGTYWVGAHKDQGAKKVHKPIRKSAEIKMGETTELILGGLNNKEVTLSGTLFVGGVPAPKFRVWGSLNDPKTFAQGKAVTTDEHGHYELEFSGPGTGYFLVVFGSREFALVPIEVGEGPLQVFDIHAPNGSLSGRVLEGDTPPERKAWVRCIPEGFAPAMSRSLTRSSMCEEDGTFLFENLTPGVYRLEVSGHMNRGSVVHDIQVGFESRVTNLELQTGGKGRITVRVIGPEGNLMNRAHVYAVDLDGFVHNHSLGGHATNPSGKIRLRKLGLGGYRFFAQTKTMVSQGSASILIDDKDQVLTLQLSHGGRLEFQYPEGLDAKQARIWVIGSQGIDYSSTLLTFDSANYVAEGELEARESIGPLPPGRYTVRIQDFGGGMLEGAATVRAGVSTRVELKSVRR